MDERINRIAALANASNYDAEGSAKYVDGAPHIKHAALRQLYGQLVVEVFDKARAHTAAPLVLDLGAGEGTVTLPFLELGARVVAVDISQAQLELLKERCGGRAMLDVRCEDVNDTLDRTNETYDVVVMNSFLHHVPDYLGLIKKTLTVLRPRGQFFSFQDPLRYDTLGRATLAFSNLAYLSWRVFGGDVVGGITRRIRRARGVYLDESIHDNAEYHVTRNGVDQDSIRGLFESMNFECRIVRYFSTQSRLFQPVGTALGVENTFGVLAQKRS